MKSSMTRTIQIVNTDPKKFVWTHMEEYNWLSLPGMILYEYPKTGLVVISSYIQRDMLGRLSLTASLRNFGDNTCVPLPDTETKIELDPQTSYQLINRTVELRDHDKTVYTETSILNFDPDPKAEDPKEVENE